MTKILMIYSIPKGNDVTRIAFNRKLFNYNLQTHKGRYKSTTKGILEEFEKPIRSCVIFQEKNLSKVKNLCEQFKIIAHFYEIKKLS